MFRNITLAAVAVLVLTVPVEAKRVARPFTSVEKLTRASIVVTGKVSALEKETVSAPQYAGNGEKVDYKIAVIKIESGLIGAENMTHVKVGFIAGTPAGPRPGRGGLAPVGLAEGQEGLFYLTKHHSGNFYVINPLMPPADAKAEDYKDQLALAKKGAAALSDPAKAFQAEKADDRVLAATVLVSKYRTYPDGGEAEAVKISAEESKLILKALAEAEWKQNSETHPNGFTLFSLLGLTDKDGWKQPEAKAGEDYVEKTKEAFEKWLDGPGKDYQISKWVPKKK